MAKIDTSGWKPFVVGELFPSMVKPPVLHARQVVETDEGIPYVVRTKFNNGIKCRVHPVSDVTPSPAGVITWGAENAAFFYQAEEFLSGRDIYYVDTRPYSATTCMFLAACLQTVVHKYPYNYGLFPDLLKEEQIRLPVDAAGEPNWAYMDEYMSAVMGESGASLESLRQTDGEKHALSVSGWQEFIIGDLFEKLQLDVKKEDFNKTFDVSEERTEEFNLPLVNAKHGNNGIMYYGRETDFETAEMTIDIVQNGAIATGDVYAQPQRTGVLWDAYLVKPKAKIDSAFTLMFLATVLEKAIKDKFSYQCCTWVNIAMQKHSRKLQLAARRRLKQYNGKWIPANQTRNLPRVHQQYKQKIPSIKYRDIYVGFTALTFCRWERTPPKNQAETPYTDTGRQLYFERTKKKKMQARLDEMYSDRSARAISYGKWGKFNNFEFIMNRAYALNRDKLRCRVCGGWLIANTPWAHRINPYLPLDKVNRVNNLISLHKKCFIAVNNPNQDISEFDVKAQKKIVGYRDKLVISHTRNK